MPVQILRDPHLNGLHSGQFRFAIQLPFFVPNAACLLLAKGPRYLRWAFVPLWSLRPALPDLTLRLFCCWSFLQVTRIELTVVWKWEPA